MSNGEGFDPSKLEGLNLTVSDEELKKIREGVEHLTNEEVDSMVTVMQEIIASDNRKKAIIDNALFVAKLILVCGARLA